MQDQTHHARVAALSMAHGAALARLLRAHGRASDADNVEAALGALVEIISDEVGRRVLTQAMNWVSDETWGCDETESASAPRH